MYKFLRPKFLPLIVAFSGVLGFLLRIWTIGDGPDRDMLYAPQPVAWTLLWILTAMTLTLIFLALRPLRAPGRYADHFPASPVSAAGSGLAAVGIASCALELLQAKGDSIASLTGIVGIAAAVGMAIVAYSRFKGIQPSFLCHLSVCIFMALRIFDRCKIWSNEPQLTVFIFPFLAMIVTMLAAYQLAAFDADMSKRRASLFWSFSGVYFCMVSLPGSDDLLFFSCIALWLMTNLSSLRPLRKRPVAQEPQAEPPVEQ